MHAVVSLRKDMNEAKNYTAALTNMMMDLNEKIDDLEYKLEQKLVCVEGKVENPEKAAVSSLQKALNTTKQDLSELATLQRTMNTTQQGFEAQLKDNTCKLTKLSSKLESMYEQLPTSCSEIAKTNPCASSGYYNIRFPDGDTASNGLSNSTCSYHSIAAVSVYCDMDTHSCGTMGWMRVANINMTNTSQECPGGFRLRTNPRRVCERISGSGCTPITFPVHSVQYGRVCGKVKAYQYGVPEAFHPFKLYSTTIDGAYVDGISITHGNTPRQHIWTLVAARDESHSDTITCPCSRTDSGYTGRVPPYIGDDYFCDTASHSGYIRNKFYDDDPLWDGEGCGSISSCCQFNSPPWFCKDLLQPTTDDIELRVCSDQDRHNEDMPFELIDLYVQ